MNQFVKDIQVQSAKVNSRRPFIFYFLFFFFMITFYFVVSKLRYLPVVLNWLTLALLVVFLEQFSLERKSHLLWFCVP